MTMWLKTFRQGNAASPSPSPQPSLPIGTRSTFYEPLSTHSDGSPKLTKHGEPMGKPNYVVGELIAQYWSDTHEVGQVWEVTDEPEQSEKIGWGWQTEVKLVAQREPGVPVGDLKIPTNLLMRRVRLRLNDEQQEQVEHYFGV